MNWKGKPVSSMSTAELDEVWSHLEETAEHMYSSRLTPLAQLQLHFAMAMCVYARRKELASIS